MKNIENFIIKNEQPITNLMFENLIKEDSRNKSIKIYDENIFRNLKKFKINIDNEDEEKEDEERKKKEEEHKKDYEETIRRIEKLSSEIELYTNRIRRDMELDAKKKEEMERLEKIRIEEERKKKEERERKKREEEERERIKREREEKERKDRERLQNLVGGTIKDKLIKGANNFENIKKEVINIDNDKSKKKISDKILLKIMELLPNITMNNDLKGPNSSGEKLKKMLKELKDENQKEYYIYSCYWILMKIKNILTSSSINFKDCYIKAKLISFLDSKTLTYMFFQNMSNSCPYIIPVKNYESLFNDKNLAAERKNKFSQNRKENINKFIIYEYLYFSFLFIDINKNIDILDDFLKNMEAFEEKDIKYLIGNSFLCFINVFGNYIKYNKSSWLTRIQKILTKVQNGLNKEKNNTKRPEIKNNIDKINNDLDDYLQLLKENKNTKFIQEIEQMK